MRGDRGAAETTKGTSTLVSAANLAVWILTATERTSSRFAGNWRFGPVTHFAGRRRAPPLSVRWPPKDGQPKPTLEQPRLPMSEDRTPLASGRAAHADDGVRGKLSMNSFDLMDEVFDGCLPNVRGKGRLAACRKTSP